MAFKSSIMVPLYIYPFPDAWSNLHQSIELHPTTHFWVIVNPGNGPGPGATPDSHYLREVPRLNSYENVTVLGYVHVSFGSRKLSAVLKDIDAYSRWTTDSKVPGLSVQGIFVDETPNEFNVRAEKFLRELTAFAKSCSGLGLDRTIVHNPGSVAPHAYTILADITVVFEDTLQAFRSRVAQGVFDRATTELRGREHQAVMIHSIPTTLDADARRDIVKLVEEIAGHVFFTDLMTEYYQSFSVQWLNWVTAVTAE